jgi:translation initiation factor IF-2
LAKELVGRITHYYDKIQVAVIELSGRLKEGDSISIEKDGQAFEQKAESMQIDRKPVKEAKKGEAIGMKVMQAVKQGFEVYKITE